MFESNLTDERFLPFENAGAISSWRLELPSEFRQFNYNTISSEFNFFLKVAQDFSFPEAESERPVISELQLSDGTIVTPSSNGKNLYIP